MFGNRKRKLSDDEESLVPHGLIWHATEEPTPEEVAKSKEALGYTVNYAQEIERVRREQSAQPIEPAPVIPSQAPPAKPAVIPWWRMAQPEAPVERPISKLTPMPLSAYVPTPIEPALEPQRPSRIQPMQIRPAPVRTVEVQPAAVSPAAVQPIQAISTATLVVPPAQIPQVSAPQVEGSLATSVQVQPSPISGQKLYNPPDPKPQVEERLVPKSSEITEALVLVFSRLRSAGKTAWLSLGSVSGKAIERGRQTARSLELGEGLARAGKYSQNLIQGGVARTSGYARATGSALSTFSRAGVSRVQQLSARRRTASTVATDDVVRPANTRPATPSRIRVLLAASALRAKIITARQLSAWRMRRERMAIDSRLWASMTMSAIAAVIALVIVSVVPHYAARSLPSRILNTNPSVDANVAAPVSTAPALVEKPVTPVRKTTTVTSTETTAAKTASVKADSAKSATNPKPKHVAQDDYVAPNTYKYYGTGSKASR
jgi:hypothetical protein